MTDSVHQGEAAALIDPVCGMDTDPGDPTVDLAGTTYRFCGKRCAEKFQADPQRYLQPTPSQEPVDEQAIYTCPMHPEVQQRGPGTCPKCGMALEPLAITA